MFGPQIIGVQALPGARSRFIGRVGCRDRHRRVRVLLALEVLVQGQRQQKFMLRLEAGQPLVERRQIIAGAVAQVLEQHHAVGPLKGRQLLIGLAQFLFQPQRFLSQPGNGCIRRLRPHFLLQNDIFLHAGLHESLGVARLAPGALQHEDRRLGQHRNPQPDRLCRQIRFLCADPDVGAVDHHPALHQRRLGAQEIAQLLRID